MGYDDDDYDFPDKSENITDEFELTEDELDQFDDIRYNIFEELEYQIGTADERITLARWEGATPLELERLEDELEILMIDYNKYIDQGE